MLNIPNILTLLRILAIPLFIAAYYSGASWGHMLATVLFVLAAITDWFDGYLARKLDQSSPFGAFLDPVADKLMVGAALVLLVADRGNHTLSLQSELFTLMVLIIISRELTVSALREWMAELGKRANVAVSYIGKFKTTAQMTAIPFLLYRDDLLGLPVFRIGEVLLYLAAALTLWSMLIYLRAAWPEMRKPTGK
ncbi:MAG: CDP-diacylglycerol--glycerol-3-phosphate 3-phosphatidyltransferase [Gammaproteobacteria bacterium]|nr:MAG: CDP-diacylglycerol--glycerol-3-phosphate 3-phosphatidyltransferase [Gammaproteobacteria bacterium]